MFNMFSATCQMSYPNIDYPKLTHINAHTLWTKKKKKVIKNRIQLFVILSHKMIKFKRLLKQLL